MASGEREVGLTHFTSDTRKGRPAMAALSVFGTSPTRTPFEGDMLVKLQLGRLLPRSCRSGRIARPV